MSKVCILAGFIVLSCGSLVRAQDAASNSDEQKKELDALRNAEAGPVVPDQPAATAPAAPAQAVTPAPGEPAPAAPTVAAPESTADQEKALQALHNAEENPAQPDKAVPNWNKKQLKEEEAQARAEAAAQKKARKEAEVEQAKIAWERKEAAAEARRKNEEEAARRAEELRAQMQSASNTGAAPSTSATPAAPALSAKEQKLADLLRRYQNDEITPYEYHMERAKIIAEP